MKAVILAGGLGTRISEETGNKPKPMIEIGGKPILWHIMKIYSSYGIKEFIICCGYKGYIIKEYFNNFSLYQSDEITFNIKSNPVTKKKSVYRKKIDNWKVTCVDTGVSTMTGGRLKKIKKHLENDKIFCMTYGDGVADINISKLIDFHKKHGKMATLTATRPPARFGALTINKNNLVSSFEEKPQSSEGWINGGFFVLNKDVLNLVKDDETVWEQEPLTSLAKNEQLFAYKHDGFWMPMDTLREKNILDNLWNNAKNKSNSAPWKIWKN